MNTVSYRAGTPGEMATLCHQVLGHLLDILARFRGRQRVEVIIKTTGPQVRVELIK